MRRRPDDLYFAVSPMTPERWQQVKALCERALEHEPSDRGEFLVRSCAADQELKRQVETLLAQVTSSDGVLDAPVWRQLGASVGPPVEAGRESDRRVPDTIGRYKVVRLVGEGGMGVVYEAEQDHPRRLVALKVIKPGLATPELLRRFERESQALGRLQHPGIAQIYEAGTADAGFGPQPYLAMEFIVGEALKEYVSSNRLDTRHRLELVARICDAVQHAHERGLIHRDLKPGNILVDGMGQPKVLDFGVARLTDATGQATRHTDVGQLVGTLQYMSPEQVSGNPLELDARTDVYSLGVILYELLTGRLPYTISDRLHEAVQTIREEDPTRLRSISRTFRGDVETIVAKALEKDKARRYPTAAALAQDIRRHLKDEPIEARPPSAVYQLQKFARRHRALVTASAAVFAILVVGIAVSTRAAVQAREAQQTAQAVNDFLQNDLLAQASADNQSGPQSKPDPDLRVRTALDRAAARVAGKFEREPAVEASIRETIGRTYMELGLYPEAQSQMMRAYDLRRRLRGSDDPQTLKAGTMVGYIDLLQGKFPEAETLLNQTMETQRRVMGPEYSDTVSTMLDLAQVYEHQGKYAKAEELDTRVLAIQRRVWGPDHRYTLKSMNNLALVYYAEGKYPQVEAIFTQLLDTRRRVLGAEHPETLQTMGNLALLYHGEAKNAESETLETETLGLMRRVLGPDHPTTLMAVNNLAVVEVELGKYSAAQELDTQALEARRRVLGRDHPDTLQSMHNLALAYYEQGSYARAEALYKETIESRSRILGPEHPRTLLTRSNLAELYGARANYAGSEEEFRQTLEISRRVLGPEHPDTLNLVSGLGSLYLRQGKYALAESYVVQALDGRKRSLGEQHPDTMSSKVDLAFAYVPQNRFAESEPLAREALEFGRRRPPDDWERFRAESVLGASLTGQKKYAEAEPLLLDAYREIAERKERIGAPNWYYLDRVSDWIVQFYQQSGKPDEASSWRRRHAESARSTR